MIPPDSKPSRSWFQPFVDAFRGIGVVLRTQANARIHVVAALGAAGLGWWLNIESNEWIALAICTGLVLIAEWFNTALEYIADRVTMLRDPLIGHAKDIAAGAVLIAAMVSATVGAIIFLPKLIEKLGGA